jgi:hypothetical protein
VELLSSVKFAIARLMIFVTCLAGSPLTTSQAVAQESPQPLRIVIIEGEDAVNNIRRRAAREPIVEVRDRNNKPVGGIILTFTLPGTGPGGTFLSTGAKLATVVTGPNGQAIMPALQVNNVAGSYNIAVSGSFQGQRFSTVIPQSNRSIPFTQSSTAKILLVAAAAGVALTIVSLAGGKSKTVITSGAPTVEPAR